MFKFIATKVGCKPSHVFWLLAGFVAQLVIGLIYYPALCVIWGIGSMFTVVHLIELKDDAPNNPWPFLFPIIWVLLVIVGVAWVLIEGSTYCSMLISNIFRNFNNRLNE